VAPANEDHEPAIVTAIGRKRLKLLCADEWAAEPHDPEEARVDPFLARMIRPGALCHRRRPANDPQARAYGKKRTGNLIQSAKPSGASHRMPKRGVRPTQFQATGGDIPHCRLLAFSC